MWVKLWGSRVLSVSLSLRARACVRLFLWVRASVCARARVRACARACVCVSLFARLCVCELPSASAFVHLRRLRVCGWCRRSVRARRPQA